MKTVAREFVGWEACVTENLPQFVGECRVCNGNVVIFSNAGKQAKAGRLGILKCDVHMHARTREGDRGRAAKWE